MKKWRCVVCSYVYDPAAGDPDNGVPPGTAFGEHPGRLGMPPLRRREGRVRGCRLTESALRGADHAHRDACARRLLRRVKDPGLAIFDIVIPTEHGTTYNSYLVKGTEKTALIDCVKRPFAAELLRNIEEISPCRSSTT